MLSNTLRPESEKPSGIIDAKFTGGLPCYGLEAATCDACSRPCPAIFASVACFTRQTRADLPLEELLTLNMQQ